MLRRRVCLPVYVVYVETAMRDGQQRRTLKTLDVREYRPLGTPIEFRFYQRYANHPNRQSGVQFLTHYSTHQRFRVNKDFIDYMHWGREQGQARLPHRHQRVAFDFDDSLQPTRVDAETKAWFAGQDPTMNTDVDVSSSFDPHKKIFSHPEHWNKMFSKRRPGEGDIKLGVLPSHSLLGPMLTQTDTQDMAYFKTETQGPTHGRVPGINAPFQGERDRRMMQAMSYPLNRRHTLTGNDGRFSKTIFMNDPKRHQVLSAIFARDLNKEVDKATNALYTKLTVLTAAQSGQTEYFSAGADFEAIGFDLVMAHHLRQQVSAIMQAVAQGGEKKAEAQAQVLLRDAERYEERADSVLRENAAVIWRAYTSPRPLMTLVNGKCRGTGCGLALAAKYAGLQDASEFVVDGPNMGLTPYSGMVRLLARPETSLKYPGLAEFVMLTGTSLFAGDALRLGWTDLFTTLPDMPYYVKEWFDSTEHMHNDAVAWQLGHLLEKCFQMKDGSHANAMERAAMTPIRARWIEDAFADQPSVEDILKTLTAMEQLSLTDKHNTCDPSYATPYTIGSVAEGVRKLEATRLRYTLSPWDITPPEAEVEVRQAADIFTAYVLERRGNLALVTHRDRHKAQAWREQREREYAAYAELRCAPHRRHVYARLEGCEGTLVDFDFTFDPVGDATAATSSSAGNIGEVPEESTASVDRLKSAVLAAMKMPPSRDVELCWYLPTLDTCPVYTDAELVDVLQSDPGLEDPAAELRYPPVYFLIKRNSLHLSEWAYAVKHQLLLQSPYALKATLQLLLEVRGDGSAEAVRSLADSLGLEYRYLTRLLHRPDFVQVGQHVDKSSEEWAAIKEAQTTQVHHAHSPLRPLPNYEAVFERDVELDGHRFPLRPRWLPRTIEEVTNTDLEVLATPLDFAKDKAVEMNVVVQTTKSDRMDGMIDDAGGYEVVPGLGEVNADGSAKAAPLKGDATVPTNVNFYEMARHPWDDTASSWRRDGFTAGSQDYFEQQFKKAEKAVYDENGRGQRSYWPSRDVSDSVAGEETNELIEERLLSKLRDAERGVENWARQLRAKAVTGVLDNKTEIATQAEKIYDDEYYRWFIQPGQHPNPSGLLRGRTNSDVASAVDKELEVFLSQLASGAATPTEVEEGLDEDVVAGMAEESDDAAGAGGDHV